MIRHSVATSPSLLLRALASTALTLTIWEAAHVCFEVYATQTMTVSQFAPKPNQTLLSGLYSPDAYFQQFAFLELATLTLTNADRRKSIFTEIKKDGAKGGAWYDISRACLKLTGEELQRAKGRGTMPAEAVDGGASSASAPSHQPSTSSLRSIEVKQEDVFKPVKKTFLDNLTASGAPAPAAAGKTTSGASTAVATSSSGSTATSRVPAIFQTSSGKETSSTTTSSKAATKPAAKQLTLEQRLSQWAPQAVKTALFERWAGYDVQLCVVRHREVIWATQCEYR